MKAAFITLLLFFAVVEVFAQAEKLVIRFPFNSSKIIASEAARLDSFLQATPQAPLHISGHTDSRGSNAFNDALSKKRADAVKDYLKANNFPKDLAITEEAFGESKLITADDLEEAKGLVNRRVEIIWKKDEKILPANGERKDPPVQIIPPQKNIAELINDPSIKIGSVLVLQNLNFEGGRHRILSSSLPQLQSLLNAMKGNPRLIISIEGHICCLAGNEDGVDFDTQTPDLSYRRAKAISEYLVYSGIEQKRILFKGLGHSMPLYPFPENTEEEKTANRRVELRILEK